MTLIWVLGSVILVSAIPLVGLFLVRSQIARVQRHVLLLVSFAVGGLLGGALLHLLPEATEHFGGGAVLSGYLLLGFLGFFILEKFLWHHSHTHDESEVRSVKPLATLNLVGDGVHNVLDGMIIAGAYATDPAVGMATTLAVILHEIPQEIGDFGVLLHAGVPVRRAVFYNFLTGLGAVVGALVALALEDRIAGFSAALVPIAAGSFLYIAASDLIPELHRERSPAASIGQVAVVLLGVALMAVLH
jgi:zinc and cadmium transporter